MTIEQQTIESEETSLQGFKEELLRLRNDVNQEIERINALKEGITSILEKYLNKYINLKFYFKDNQYLIIEHKEKPSELPQCKLDLVSGKLFINNKDSNISLSRYIKNLKNNSDDENNEFAIMLINGMELAIKETNIDRMYELLNQYKEKLDEISEIDKNIAEIDKNIAEIDKDIAETEKNIAEIDKNIAEIDKDIAEKEKNIAETEKNIAEIDKNIAEIKKNIAKYNKQGNSTRKKHRAR